MFVRIRRPIFAILIVLCPLISAHSVIGQNVRDDLSVKLVKRFEMSTDNIHLILSQISDEYEVPIGLEAAAGGTKGHQVRLSTQDGTLRDLFNSIIEQDTRYEWTVIDGVVNFSPKVGRDDLLKKLLEIRIREFSITTEKSRYSIKTVIKNLPEVKSFLDEVKIVYSAETFFSGDRLKVNPEFSRIASCMTLRDVLNQIIRTSDARYWIVNRYGDNGENLVINF